MAQTAFAAAGLDNINITDGVRTRAENTAVGGATGSRHIAENGGDAIDIKLPEGMTTAEKVNLIRQLSAAGVGGIGVYRTQIHIDLGARRSWGPSYSAGENLSGIPAWARGVIGEHLAGSISATPRAYVADEFSTMNEGTRQTAMAEARRLVAATARENAVPISDQRALFTQQTDDVIANIYNTGQGADTIDMDQAREILTVSGRIKLDEDIFVAQQVYAATDGISGMTEAQLEALLTQTRPETTGDTFGDVGDRIATEIAAEVEEVRQERRDEPAAAAMGDPTVREAYEGIAASLTTPVGGARQEITAELLGQPTIGEAMQNYIRASIAQQRTFGGLHPAARQYVWRENALQVGEQLFTLIGDTDKPKEQFEFELEAWYAHMQQTYGEYTDDVIMQALRESKTLGGDVEGSRAARIQAAMEAVSAGRTPNLVDGIIDTPAGIDPTGVISEYFGNGEPLPQTIVNQLQNRLIGKNEAEAIAILERSKLSPDQVAQVMAQRSE